ncbi:carbohydrate ABC transporter permease [Paenibacillus septentrionalis]|uniref:Carbohydrate ABC transporter permease n=1 Tax=Paenibacillus septentrionalis TaxID=429342 RepID=A0ABW1V5V4_9BACL
MQKMIKKYFALFALPTLIAFAVAFVVPFVLGVYLSFTEFTTVTDARWIGLGNYLKAFQDRDFLNALWFTAKFTIVSVVLINVFAFLLALLLTKKVLGKNVFRTVFFMPNLIGGIVLGYIWQLIINGVLYQFDVTLTSNANYGFWGLVILMNWQLIGYMMIIYIAGIQNVPKEQLEAAKIDGATNGTILRKIILPLVMPSITICLFLSISNSFKLFDQNLALTAGAPSRQTAMLALDIFNTFYSKAGFEGVGQAKAVMFFVMVALIVVVQLAITRRREIEN